MKKLFTIFAAACAFLAQDAAAASPTGPCCRPVPKWYAGVSGGLTFLGDVDISHSNPAYPTPDGQSYNIGYGMSGQLGYRLFPNIRAEVEFSYRQNHVDSDPGAVNQSNNNRQLSSQRSMAYMANVYYDFHNDTRLTPYIGAGVGEARVINPRYYINNGTGETSAKLSAWTFAYQFMAGANFALDTSFAPVEVSVGYRYFTGKDPSDNVDLPGFPSKMTWTNDSHNLELGGRVYF